jgi:hypothetical protein
MTRLLGPRFGPQQQRTTEECRRTNELNGTALNGNPNTARSRQPSLPVHY